MQSEEALITSELFSVTISIDNLLLLSAEVKLFVMPSINSEFLALLHDIRNFTDGIFS